MVGNRLLRQFLRSGLAALVLSTSVVLVPAHAAGAGLGDYLWQRRPLLVFTPTDTDPRLAETLRRTEASRCAFVDRDMVLGVIAGQGASTLDGHAIDATEAQRLSSEFGIGADSFSVVLIGKDGGEKARIPGVPEMSSIYAVVDGMPMRSREMSATQSRC